MKNRIKKNLQRLTTRDDAEAAMNGLALATNDQRRLIAIRDQAVLEINERYATGLAELDRVVSEKYDALRAWAEANPEQFPKDRKSIDMAAGTLGFRTGTPKLALLSRAWTWDKVLSLVAQICPHYIRQKMEVDKDAMLADYSQSTAKDVTSDKFKRVGLEVAQDESFYVEPNLTELESRTSEAT